MSTILFSLLSIVISPLCCQCQFYYMLPHCFINVNNIKQCKAKTVSRFYHLYQKFSPPQLYTHSYRRGEALWLSRGKPKAHRKYASPTTEAYFLCVTRRRRVCLPASCLNPSLKAIEPCSDSLCRQSRHLPHTERELLMEALFVS